LAGETARFAAGLAAPPAALCPLGAGREYLLGLHRLGVLLCQHVDGPHRIESDGLCKIQKFIDVDAVLAAFLAPEPRRLCAKTVGLALAAPGGLKPGPSEGKRRVAARDRSGSKVPWRRAR
jgi:hypothetical protein